MAKIKKISIKNDTSDTFDSRDIGAEAQYIDVNYDANGNIIEDITAAGVTIANTKTLTKVLKDNSLVNLADTKINEPTNKQGLIYNSDKEAWVNADIEGISGANNLSELEDVSFPSTPTDNQTLIYNATTRKWSNGAYTPDMSGKMNINGSNASSRLSFPVTYFSTGSGYANGQYSTAEGYQTCTSDGVGAHAEGYQTCAYDYGSHAEGYGSCAAGRYSHAEGQSKAIGSWSHAEGQGTANGNTSHAEGYSQTYSEGEYAHAEGYTSVAKGKAAHAEGGSEATGEYSHAEADAWAKGNYSHAEGINSYTEGQGSHAEGYRTCAIGDYSHAEGYQTCAASNNSHTGGKFTATSSAGENSFIHGLGKNSSDILTTTKPNSFIFGNRSVSKFPSDMPVHGSDCCFAVTTNKEYGEINGTYGAYVELEGSNTWTRISIAEQGMYLLTVAVCEKSTGYNKGLGVYFITANSITTGLQMLTIAQSETFDATVECNANSRGIYILSRKSSMTSNVYRCVQAQLIRLA